MRSGPVTSQETPHITIHSAQPSCVNLVACFRDAPCTFTTAAASACRASAGAMAALHDTLGDQALLRTLLDDCFSGTTFNAAHSGGAVSPGAKARCQCYHPFASEYARPSAPPACDTTLCVYAVGEAPERKSHEGTCAWTWAMHRACSRHVSLAPFEYRR